MQIGSVFEILERLTVLVLAGNAARSDAFFVLDGCLGRGGSWGSRPMHLLCEDPSRVDAAAAKEAVMHHTHAKQINRGDESSQKQELHDCEPRPLIAVLQWV